MAKRTLEQQKADIEIRLHRERHTDAVRTLLDKIRVTVNASTRDYDATEKLAEQLLTHAKALKAGPQLATAPESSPVSDQASIPFPAATTGNAS